MAANGDREEWEIIEQERTKPAEREQFSGWEMKLACFNPHR
jgi:hypothetical protein